MVWILHEFDTPVCFSRREESWVSHLSCRAVFDWCMWTNSWEVPRKLCVSARGLCGSPGVWITEGRHCRPWSICLVQRLPFLCLEWRSCPFKLWVVLICRWGWPSVSCRVYKNHIQNPLPHVFCSVPCSPEGRGRCLQLMWLADIP